MPSDKERSLQLVAAKAEEMSDSLTSWAKDELILPFGNRIRVTLEIVPDSGVDVEYVTGETIFDRAPTPKEWKEIMGLPWNLRKPSYKGVKSDELIGVLLSIRDSGTNHYSGRYHYKVPPSLNDFFRKNGDRFRTSEAGGRLSIWAAR